ncbi:MAG: response regulator, partial [Hymenobacter sp.]
EQLGTASPPIVAMTAYSMPDDAARFVEAGLDDYLAKPVRHQQLAAILTRWIAPMTPKPTPPAPAPAPPTLIDPEVLSNLLEVGDIDFVNELYVEFVEEASDILMQATIHWQAANLDGLQPLLHQLKGTAGTLGLTQLAAQALRLEKAIKDNETNALHTGIPELNRLFEQFIAHYPAQLTT